MRATCSLQSHFAQFFLRLTAGDFNSLRTLEGSGPRCRMAYLKRPPPSLLRLHTLDEIAEATPR